MNPLVIRADANTQIGTGHIMRCLALAQAWQESGGEVYFVTVFSIPALETRLINEGFKVVFLDVDPGSQTDAEQTAKIAHNLGKWLVVDGYHFGADYQKVIKDNHLKLLFVDDYGHAEHYYADIVLNQNIYATETLYPNREPDTCLLLGTEYVLLRREFWPWRNWEREIPAVAHKVLVTLGGGDPDNQTLKVIQALQKIKADNLEVVVVVGGSNPHLVSLQAVVTDSPHAIRLVQNVTNMPELMAWADIAVSAGGSTSWELAFMGLPTLILVIADNQREIAVNLASVGIALNFGSAIDGSIDDIGCDLQQLLTGSSDLHISMSLKGQQLVDGRGGQQIVAVLNNGL